MGGGKYYFAAVPYKSAVFGNDCNFVQNGREQFFKIGQLSAARGRKQHAFFMHFLDKRKGIRGHNFARRQQRAVQIACNKFNHLLNNITNARPPQLNERGKKPEQRKRHSARRPPLFDLERFTQRKAGNEVARNFRRKVAVRQNSALVV